MVTIKKIFIRYTRKEMRRKSKHVTAKKKNELSRKEGSMEDNEGRKSCRTKKIFFLMALVSPSLSVIALNVNGLNSSFKRRRLV